MSSGLSDDIVMRRIAQWLLRSLESARLVFMVALVLAISACGTGSMSGSHSPTSDLNHMATENYYEQKVMGRIRLIGSASLPLGGFIKIRTAYPNSNTKEYIVKEVEAGGDIEIAMLPGGYAVQIYPGQRDSTYFLVEPGSTIVAKVEESKIQILPNSTQLAPPRHSGTVHTIFELNERIGLVVTFAAAKKTENVTELLVNVKNGKTPPVFRFNEVPVSPDFAENLSPNQHVFNLKLREGVNVFSVTADGPDGKTRSREYTQYVKSKREIEEEERAKREAEQAKQKAKLEEEERLRRVAAARKMEEERIAREGDGSPDDLQCKKYGFKPQGQGYPECRMRLDLDRREQARVIEARRQAAQNEQARIQGEQEAAQKIREARYSNCMLVKAQEYARPGVGNFFQSAANANAAFNNCMNGVPTVNTTCTNDGFGNLTCTSR